MAEAGQRDGGAARLPDEEVRERLGRLERLLELVEHTPGPSGELAMSAVTELAQVYGEALARAVGYAADTAAAGSPALLEALVGDELVSHLLVLHGIHPEPVEPRVRQAVQELRPAVAEHGGDVALRGIEGDVATVALTVGGCGSATRGLADAVREAVLCVAPELADVVVTPSRPAAAPAFVPLNALSAPAHADTAHQGAVLAHAEEVAS